MGCRRHFTRRISVVPVENSTFISTYVVKTAAAFIDEYLPNYAKYPRGFRISSNPNSLIL